MKTNSSYFFYIHPDLNGTPNVHKLGITKTPYSAVRARQKFCWNQFGLTHLYFGLPYSIGILESKLKSRLLYQSGNKINGFGAQTEMFMIPIDDLISQVDGIIADRKLNILRVELPQPYTASNSGQCPFGIPTEDMADVWAYRKAQEIFGEDAHKIDSTIGTGFPMFANLFETMENENEHA